jgi:PAS domain S-box-containing protein
LRESGRAIGGGKHVPISKARRYAVAIFISCLGLFLTVPYLIGELLEAYSFTDFLQHFIQPSRIFHHIMMLLAIPAFMLVGYFYLKQQNLADNLERMVEERTERLRESQTRLKNVFAASPDAIAVFDLDGNVIECNQATLDMLGYSSGDEVIGKCAFTFIAKKDHARMTETLKNLPELNSIRNVEYIILARNGQEFPVELSASVVRDTSGKPTGFVVIIKGITERKRAEEKIRKEKEFTLSLLKGLKEGFAVVDQDGKQILVNDELCKMTGYSEKELLNQKPPFKYWAEEGLEDINKAFEKTLRGVEGEYELIFKRKNGERFIALVSPRKTVDSDGNTLFFATVKDITKRKRAEEALRESEEKFRNIFESANDCIIYLDRSGRILDVNGKAVQVFGGSKKELLGKHFTKLSVFSPTCIPTLKNNFADIFAGKKTTLNVCIKNKKGREIPLECSASLIKIGDKLTGMMVIARDITERKKMEKKLRQYSENLEAMVEKRTKALADSEKRYSTLVERAHDGIAITTPERIIFANKRLQEITGYPKEELLRITFDKLLTPESMWELSESRKAYAKGESVPNLWQLKLRSKQGHILTVETSFTPVSFEGQSANLVIVRDITERKKAEEKLRFLKEFSERVLNSLSDPLLVIDPNDYTITRVNEAALKQLKLRKEDLIGKTCYEITHHRSTPCKPPHDICPIQEMLKTGKAVTVEHTHFDKDNNEIHVEVSVSPVRNHEGNIVQVVHLARDITERKKMQELLLKTERLAAIGELATMVGHDLRNPLQSIENATYYLNNELPRLPIPKKAMEMLQLINDSVNYADRIVRDLQDFSAARKPLLRKTDVNAIVKEALSQVEASESVQLITELGHLPRIEADKNMIKRVFLNLALNGIQAMANGGTLKVSTKRTRGFVEISFKDTGIGIPKENMGKLFTPFFTTKAKGMGMGLAICKKFVDAHGGSIEVKSEEGKGSTFTVKLPIQ